MALCHFPSFFSPFLKPNIDPHFKCGPHLHLPPKNLIFSCSAEKASKKGRKASKATKSNEQLRLELVEFLLTRGHPENHVPTMKELTEHGRKDLANIVRRRGYKVVAELLAASTRSDGGSDEPSVDQGLSGTCRDEAADSSSVEEKNMISANGTLATDCSDQNSESLESSIEALQLKATNFIQSGELNLLDDASEVEEVNEHTYSNREPTNLNSNGDITTDPTSQLALTLAEDYPYGSQEPELDDNITEKVSKVDNLAEIDRLKAILRQKQMELSELEQLVEKEKQALSILQAKANTEIRNAQTEITEKDIELRSTEESLFGLKEVQIEYWVNGETVEITGSFNGWHHRIKMDLVSSKNLDNSPVSRNSKLWSTVLWLYPGVYEIKFIVDGNWRINPNIEMISSGNITNNVLRVDR